MRVVNKTEVDVVSNSDVKCEPWSESPVVLRVQRKHGLVLFLLRRMVGERIHLGGSAVRQPLVKFLQMRQYNVVTAGTDPNVTKVANTNLTTTPPVGR